jgi:hypothetical protein
VINLLLVILPTKNTFRNKEMMKTSVLLVMLLLLGMQENNLEVSELYVAYHYLIITYCLFVYWYLFSATGKGNSYLVII